MHRYDPDKTPDAKQWLALDEDERNQLVEKYHRKHRIELPNSRVHASLHVVVENQIAEGLDCVVRAMDRLQVQGLSRHDTLHAIATVLAMHLNDLLRPGTQHDPATAHDRYYAEVERLDAQAWLDGTIGE